MEFRTRFKFGDQVYTYQNNILQKYTIAGIVARRLTPSAIVIEYLLWTGTEEIGVPEEMCFANGDEVLEDLEKQFEKLRNQESDEN